MTLIVAERYLCIIALKRDVYHGNRFSNVLELQIGVVFLQSIDEKQTLLSPVRQKIQFSGILFNGNGFVSVKVLFQRLKFEM